MPRILGTGFDLTEVDRIQTMLDRWGDRFRQRVFREEEIRYCQRKRKDAECFAARWAAKEAGFKALGGVKGTRSWRDYEVTRDVHGRPSLLLHGRAAAHAETLGVETIHLSLSHDSGLAAALVVVEGASFASD